MDGDGRQLRLPLPSRATPSPLPSPTRSLRGENPAEAAFLALQEHGKLAGLEGLVRFIGEARGPTLSQQELRSVLCSDLRFTEYGPGIWGLRAVGMDGTMVSYAPTNPEIGQGTVLARAVTEALFYGCPVAPEAISVLSEDDRRIPDARGVRLVTRYVLTGLRAWMHSVGFSYDGQSSLVITYEDFSKGVFRVARRRREPTEDALVNGMSIELAAVLRALLRRRREWIPLVDVLPQALYLWPGKGTGPCAPFETVLKEREAFRVKLDGKVRLAPRRGGAAGIAEPAGDVCNYVLCFYDVPTGRARAGVKPSAPCPCGSGRTFGKCCRRARPR